MQKNDTKLMAQKFLIYLLLFSDKSILNFFLFVRGGNRVYKEIKEKTRNFNRNLFKNGNIFV